MQNYLTSHSLSIHEYASVYQINDNFQRTYAYIWVPEILSIFTFYSSRRDQKVKRKRTMSIFNNNNIINNNVPIRRRYWSVHDCVFYKCTVRQPTRPPGLNLSTSVHVILCSSSDIYLYYNQTYSNYLTDHQCRRA